MWLRYQQVVVGRTSKRSDSHLEIDVWFKWSKVKRITPWHAGHFFTVTAWCEKSTQDFPCLPDAKGKSPTCGSQRGSGIPKLCQKMCELSKVQQPSACCSLRSREGRIQRGSHLPSRFKFIHPLVTHVPMENPHKIYQNIIKYQC